MQGGIYRKLVVLAFEISCWFECFVKENVNNSIIFSCVIVKTALCANTTFTHICTHCKDTLKWLCLKVMTLLCREERFFMHVCVSANALADPSFRDVYLSECDMWLNQDWSDTRKMSGEQPEQGKCQRSQRGLLQSHSHAHVSVHTHITLRNVRTHCIYILYMCIDREEKVWQECPSCSFSSLHINAHTCTDINSPVPLCGCVYRRACTVG